ncbi:hypothetical protein GVN24_29845 [Rhizobium sp. CRIBSB]|nr:hypothetical protein [Rhizobium sp. CRIBSB]
MTAPIKPDRLTLALTLALGLGLGGMAVPAIAQTAPAPEAQTRTPAEPRLIDRLINTPFVQNWNTWGLSSTPAPRPAQGVTGGEALPIDVTRAGDPWSVGAVMVNTGEIKAGDVLLLGVWVRTVETAGGVAETRIPTLLLERSIEPKTPILQASNVRVGSAWTMIYASGVAQADTPAGQSAIIMQMGQAAHSLELGPALLFDFGPDYDRARLPRNPVD